MTTNDLQRAATLANLFANPTPLAEESVERGEESTTAPAKKPRRTLAVVDEDAPSQETAVAEAVGVLDTVITIPVDVEADDLHAAVEEDAVADKSAAGEQPDADVDLVEQLTTKLGLKGAADRHNIPVSEATGRLLRSLDKELALSGRPIVSRNALITAAARKVIADPSSYADSPGRDPREPSAAIQGRVPAGMPAALRAAAYSVEPPLVVAHAMAAAVEQLLDRLQKEIKRGRRTRR